MTGTRRKGGLVSLRSRRALAQQEGNAMPTTATKATPLALSDEQLDQIMRTSAVLHPALRPTFVEHVAHRLQGKTIGDGEVFRACHDALRASGWTPPLETEPGEPRHVGKYGR
jgi:hypothetical protein